MKITEGYSLTVQDIQMYFERGYLHKNDVFEMTDKFNGEK